MMTTGCRVAVMNRSLICALTSVSPATCAVSMRKGPPAGLAVAEHGCSAAHDQQAACHGTQQIYNALVCMAEMVHETPKLRHAGPALGS